MAAAAAHVSDALLEQLAPGGRMVLPVGTRQQHLTLVERTSDGLTRTTLDPVRFVPLLPGAQT
jgi:protein-L-isoaspartate(D-aspartate) O-methyltransferase